MKTVKDSFRREHGKRLPAFNRWRPQEIELLGTMRNSELARRLNRGMATFRLRRRISSLNSR